MAIWIIYWTVSLDTASQSRRDILTPRLLLAVRSPPSPFATGRPLTPGLSTFPVNPATVVGSANLKNVFSFPLLLPPASAATSSAKRQPLLPCLLYPIPAIRPRAKLSNKFPRQIHRSSFLLFLFFFLFAEFRSNFYSFLRGLDMERNGIINYVSMLEFYKINEFV